MRKTAIGISILFVVALLSSVSLAQRPDRPGRQGTDEAALGQRLQQQINELKSNHQELVNTLRAIHQAAVKENATETAGKIETLIRQREQTHQEALRRLEQQQQRLQRASERGQRPGGAVRGQTGGKQAADFTLQTFDGKTVSLSDYEDKIVVLEWFNLECPFVQYHHVSNKTMADLANKYKDKGVVWLAVNSTSHATPAANQQFAAAQKLPYPILDDRSGDVGRKYGAKTTPHVFVIDTNGAIVYDGAIDNAPLGKVQGGADKVNYVDKVLSELTSGQNASVASSQPYGCSVKYANQS